MHSRNYIVSCRKLEKVLLKISILSKVNFKESQMDLKLVISNIRDRSKYKEIIWISILKLWHHYSAHNPISTYMGNKLLKPRFLARARGGFKTIVAIALIKSDIISRIFHGNYLMATGSIGCPDSGEKSLRLHLKKPN